MKKLLRALLLVLALPLAGCAGDSILRGGTSIIASTENPITSDRLFQIEATFDIAVKAAKAYRRSCLRKALPQSCREIVEYIRPLASTARRTLLPRLRAYVRDNDQVNAIKVFFELKGLVEDIKANIGVPS